MIVQGDVVVVANEKSVFAVDRAAGKERWRRELPGEQTFTLAGGLVVLRPKDGPVEVVDPATGATRWRDTQPGRHYVVRDDAIYADDCAYRSKAQQNGCTIEALEVAGGQSRWKLPSAGGGIGDDQIGSGRPHASASGPYVAAAIDAGSKPIAAVDTRTGQPLPGRTGGQGWYRFAVSKALED